MIPSPVCKKTSFLFAEQILPFQISGSLETAAKQVMG
jgi:hypothetical protein